MREIRLYGSEGGEAARSPYPYHWLPMTNPGFRPFAGMTETFLVLVCSA